MAEYPSVTNRTDPAESLRFQEALTSLLADVPYPQLFHSDLVPVQLNLQAALAGVPRLDLRSPFRYCDIGCASGSTLLGLASVHSDAEFVGIDLDSSAIDAAMQRARQCGLANLDLRCADILDLHALEFAPFDYIVAHGIVSWVDGKTVRRLLEFVASRLKPGGLFFVSYNQLPEADLLRPIRLNVEQAVKSGQAETWESCLRSAIRAWEADYRERFGTNTRLQAIRQHITHALREGWAHEFLSQAWRPYDPIEWKSQLSDRNLVHVSTCHQLDLNDGFMQSWNLCRRDVFVKDDKEIPPRQYSDPWSCVRDMRFVLTGHYTSCPQLLWAEGIRLGVDQDVLRDIRESTNDGTWCPGEYASYEEQHGRACEPVLRAIAILNEYGMLDPCLDGPRQVQPGEYQKIRFGLVLNRLISAGGRQDQGVRLISPVTCNAVELSSLEHEWLRMQCRNPEDTTTLESAEELAALQRLAGDYGAGMSRDELLAWKEDCRREFRELRVPELMRLGVCEVEE